MRIAICLSGQPRTWRYTYETLFNFFDGHALDVFVHTWDDIEPSELEALTTAYAPRVVSLGERPLFLEAKRAMAARFPVTPPFTILDMFHSMAASIGLALDGGAPPGSAYDLICRTRFDTIYDGRWDAERPAPGSIVVQSGEFEPPGGCNDQFAIGAPQDMRRYAGITTWLPQGMAGLKPPCLRPEVALQTYLQDVCGLTIVRKRFALTLLRSYHAGKPFSEVCDDPLHHAVKREDWANFAQTHVDADIAARLDFRHYGRVPLMLDKWLHAQPLEVRKSVLSGDWEQRIVAIDAVLQGEAGGPMDAERYRMVRLIDAALINRMHPDEPICLESFIVHALSANLRDMKKALAWALEDQSRLDALPPILDRLPILGVAYRFAQPFLQDPTVGWRPLDDPA